MERITHAAVRVAVFEAHTMSDAALLRLARGASEVVALTSAAGNDLVARWAALVPDTPLVDGGFVRDLRQAMAEAARRGIGQIAVATPRDPMRTVGFALQGAASAADLDVPAMAIRIMRNADGGEGVALFTDTGEPSGYATLYALALAELDGIELTSIAAKQGGRLRRNSDGLTGAIEGAEPSRAKVTERTALDPLEVVLAQNFSIAVHAVLDVRAGGDLLSAQELGARAFEGANVRRLLRLIAEFKGDVVLVFDGVRLLHGRRRAQRTAAGVGMEFGALAGAAYASAVRTEPLPTVHGADVRRGRSGAGFSIPELADEVPPAQLDVPSFPPAARVPVQSSALRYPDQVVLRVTDGDTVLVTNPTREPLRVLLVATAAADAHGSADTSLEIGTVPIGRVDQRMAIPSASVDATGTAASRSITVEAADGDFRVELYSRSGTFESGDIVHEHVPPSLLPERPVASPQPRYVERETVEPSTLVVPVVDEPEMTEPSVAVEPEAEAESVVAEEPAPEPIVELELEPEAEPAPAAQPEAEPELFAAVKPEPEPEPVAAVAATKPEPEPLATVELPPAPIAETAGPAGEPIAGALARPVPIPPGAMFDSSLDIEPPPAPREGSRRPAVRSLAPVHAKRGGRAIGMSRRERRLAREAAQLQEQATLAQEL